MVENINEIKTEVLQEITANQAWHYQVVPFRISDSDICFFTDGQAMNENKIEELELLFGKSIKITNVNSDVIQEALVKYYRKPGENGDTFSINSNGKNNSSLTSLIKEAKSLGSSDIHLEAYEEHCRIRLRVDGVLIERYKLGKEEYPSLVNKIKIKSNLDIAEKRLPQDGRIYFKEADHKFDIRVSTLPTLHGEKIVMRILSDNNTRIAIDSLGFQKKDLENYLEGVYRPNGMVLISGPTGSGKTTTLYATLQILNDISRNILTIEDPIEYTLEGINQVQLKESIGLDFASAMRTFLRQDPDTIMVGEIRDVNTASMAIRASLTGHVVLSTIHTNHAWGIVARLLDMGVPSYLLADTLNTAVAQRLVRLLCEHCKEKHRFNKGLFPRSFKAPINIEQHFVAKGCEKCHYTGYKGRKAVYEVVSIDEILSEKIKNKDLNIKHILKERDIESLADNAFKLVSTGQTSIQEIHPILTANNF